MDYLELKPKHIIVGTVLLAPIVIPVMIYRFVSHVGEVAINAIDSTWVGHLILSIFVYGFYFGQWAMIFACPFILIITVYVIYKRRKKYREEFILRQNNPYNLPDLPENNEKIQKNHPNL